jgi:hypothetical protein
MREDMSTSSLLAKSLGAGIFMDSTPKKFEGGRQRVLGMLVQASLGGM